MDNGLITVDEMVGPFRFVRRDGIIVGASCEGIPTEDQSLEAIHYVWTLEETGKWVIAHILALIPKEYGRTFHKAQTMISWLTQSTIDSYRILGRRCPPELVRPELSFSHHMSIYVTYAGVVPDDERDWWIDRLMDQFDIPENEGKTWSVKELERRICAHYQVNNGVFPSDDLHDSTVQIAQLAARAEQAEGKLELVRKFIETQVAQVIRQNTDIDLEEVVIEPMKELLASRVAPQGPEHVKEWHVLPDNDGHTVMAKIQTENGEVTKFLFESKFPDFAIEDLKRRLK